MTRIAVTGASGFIGSHLVDRLLADGHTVVALLRLKSQSSVLEERGVQVIRGDVTDPAAVERTVADCHVVFHLARAKAHTGLPIRVVDSVNVGGAGTVTEVASRVGVARLVLGSSVQVYGARPRMQPLTENAPLRLESAYGRSKVRAEQETCSRAGSTLSVAIARITTVIGPRCTSWLPLIRSIYNRRLRLVGRGDNWHHPADVSDIVDGLVRCGTEPVLAHSVYNLAGPEPVRAIELVRIIAGELGVRGSQPRPVPALPIRLYVRLNSFTDLNWSLPLPRAAGASFLGSDRVFDMSRARQDLSYAPTVGVRDAVRRMVAWYREQGLV
jgi:nucleoside-diphosphate-sugar epimerase